MTVAGLPSLRLTELRMERFKASFKEAKLLFRPFNVIIGRNGTGKSTSIEALQWIDTAIREDVSRSCDPYHGIHDLINYRSKTSERYFRIGLEWESSDKQPVEYEIKVKEDAGSSLPMVADEYLTTPSSAGRKGKIISTSSNGLRFYRPRYTRQRRYAVAFLDDERLALGTVFGALGTRYVEGQYAAALHQFWNNAVFLRLSPIGLAQVSRVFRKSYEPLLDQEGRLLPALLSEMTKEQIVNLVESIKKVLPDIRGLILPPATRSKHEESYFSLLEHMPHAGRKGRKVQRVPSWMLSEGTRRLTAIFALLHHNPPPSLLAIEEIENGLDPWTVKTVLKELESASRRGTQVIVTTHSPWLLDSVKASDITYVQRVEGETEYRQFMDRDDVKAYIDRVPPGSIYVAGQ